MIAPGTPGYVADVIFEMNESKNPWVPIFSRFDQEFPLASGITGISPPY